MPNGIRELETHLLIQWILQDYLQCNSPHVKEALPKIIHPSQKAYMQGRFIGEAARSIYDFQYYSVKHCVPLTVVLVDFSKAFDTV